MNSPENCGTCKFMTMNWYQVHKQQKPTCNKKLPSAITKRSDLCCLYIPNYKVYMSTGLASGHR